MSSPERLRRALARRNEATHPVELPDPADEAAYAARARTNAREEDRLLREGIDVGPPGYRDAPRIPWSEGDPCSLCGEDETPDDPLGHFVGPDNSTYVMAHGQCGLDHGLRLA